MFALFGFSRVFQHLKRTNFKVQMETKEAVNTVPYHQVDERWAILSYKDYQSYLDKLLVKGNFHLGVPEDVKESYKIVEYLIAHAWYHYPMYDEALNRALRTFELAIKKKCILLSIPIVKANNKDKRLVDLMDEICSHESNKRIGIFLKFLRELRNLLMHPSEHHYGGGIAHDKIILVVNTINILFAQENMIVQMDELRTERQKQLSFLTGKPLIVNQNNKAKPVHSLGICDVLNNGKNEIIKISVDLIFILNETIREKRAYPKTMFYEVINPTINSEQITGTEFKTGENISFTIATDKHIVEAHQIVTEYLYSLSAGPPLNINPYLTNHMSDISDGLQKFRYHHYQSIKI